MEEDHTEVTENPEATVNLPSTAVRSTDNEGKCLLSELFCLIPAVTFNFFIPQGNSFQGRLRHRAFIFQGLRIVGTSGIEKSLSSSHMLKERTVKSLRVLHNLCILPQKLSKKFTFIIAYPHWCPTVQQSVQALTFADIVKFP